MDLMSVGWLQNCLLAPLERQTAKGPTSKRAKTILRVDLSEIVLRSFERV
jgi:hypothetical protein